MFSNTPSTSFLLNTISSGKEPITVLASARSPPPKRVESVTSLARYSVYGLEHRTVERNVILDDPSVSSHVAQIEEESQYARNAFEVISFVQTTRNFDSYDAVCCSVSLDGQWLPPLDQELIKPLVTASSFNRPKPRSFGCGLALVHRQHALHHNGLARRTAQDARQ